MSSAPISDAFRTLRRNPSLWLAEIAWRWGFGAAALALSFLTLWTWLDSLPVSNIDRLMLGSGSPDLVGRALSHVFAGSGVLLMRAATVLVPAFVLLWTIAAAVGRAAILRTLQPDVAGNWRSLIAVSFLRAMAAVAALVGALAAFIVLARVAAPRPPAEGQPGAAWLLFLMVIFAVSVCWSLLNWFLSIAPIYAVRTESLGQALGETFFNFREQTGAWFRIVSIFGLIHFGLSIFFSIIGPIPLSWAGTLPRWFVLLAVTGVTLAYCALVDAVSVLRLIAYISIATDTPEKVTADSGEPEPAAIRP